MMKKKFIFLVLIPLFVGCQVDGVRDDETPADGITIADNDTLQEEDPLMMLNDTVDGEANEMVYQREDGLRIEWSKKENDRIKNSDVVMVNYTARVAAGEVYDSNRDLGDPVPLVPNLGMMVPGWEAGLLQMNVGDNGRIMIPAAQAYGEDGYMTIVPPKADLIVDIEIVKRIQPIELDKGVKVYKWRSEIGGATPKKGQRITFDYFAYQRGKNPGMYDNSYQNENPFSFTFENDNVVDGLHIGMSVLKPGENAFIVIPAKAAYGSKGLLDLVPKNADIVYDVRVGTIE